ncbi:MAG: alpha/beta fold hydrolase [Pyrinomonadaceae bacterium]|jgi:pimeloyl-ACP methyl ester carboxylesterase|nr:alpha/beta fold hydrolase [Pyrinomonadaceae bacterium]
MASRRRLGKKLFKSLLPILLVMTVALVVALAFIVRGITRPPRSAYLVTPKAFSQISGPALKVSDQTWRNRDNTPARGWLLRGAEGAPAVVLLHHYGADRSWLFNLGVKINEATNFTILWPDLRGHGLVPPVQWTSFGTFEGEDVLAALDFLRAQKSENGNRLVGDQVGLFGVELGALAALRAATQDKGVSVLALDSVPHNPDELVQTTVKDDLGITVPLLPALASLVTHVYFLGRYENTSTCEIAASLSTQRVLLLSGPDAGELRESTIDLARCFKNPASVEVKTDLPLTAFNLPSATGQDGEGYDRQVIEFLDKNLR